MLPHSEIKSRLLGGGGISTNAKWKQPVGSAVSISHLSSSCGQVIHAAQHKPAPTHANLLGGSLEYSPS